MQSRVLGILTILSISFSVAAQSESSAPKPNYFLSVHTGGLLGKKGNGSSLSTAFIQGVRYKRLALGAGIGYDAYLDWRMLPIFGSFGYDLTSRAKNTFFVQIHAGHSKAWNPLVNEQEVKYDQEGGGFFHPLLGYRLTNGNLNVCLTMGYKFQRLRYESTPMWWAWGSKTTIRREMERLSVQIGIGFR